MGSFELSDRPRRVLATLVREYIETGEPVSSQRLARKSGLGVSSATVRNVLAQLEDLGYVHQPHTSAGRVPTDRGYRVFVDLLLESRRLGRRSFSEGGLPRPPFNVEDEIRAQAGRSPLIVVQFSSPVLTRSPASVNESSVPSRTEEAVCRLTETSGDRPWASSRT